jgi:DnaJ-class molecular chaperone
MYNEVECPDCGGIGIYEDRKGNEHPCNSCKGKGKLDASLIKKEVGSETNSKETSSKESEED